MLIRTQNACGSDSNNYYKNRTIEKIAKNFLEEKTRDNLKESTLSATGLYAKGT